MTDPEFADATYIEPITPEAVEKILACEKAKGHADRRGAADAGRADRPEYRHGLL